MKSVARQPLNPPFSCRAGPDVDHRHSEEDAPLEDCAGSSGSGIGSARTSSSSGSGSGVGSAENGGGGAESGEGRGVIPRILEYIFERLGQEKVRSGRRVGVTRHYMDKQSGTGEGMRWWRVHWVEANEARMAAGRSRTQCRHSTQ